MNRTTFTTYVVFGLLLTGSLTPCVVRAADTAALAERSETPEQRDARMKWWRDARFGMFIHWGTYAVPAGEWKGKNIGNCGEWIQCWCKIPVAEYAKLAEKFNPVKYDAEQWVLAAKAAGMKYIVITSKHHEGFAMFKTAASPYNIVDATLYKHDPLKDLVAACRKHGMRIGFYYSQNLDWHHAGGGSGEWDKAHAGDPDAYVKKIVIPQVREILANYGPIDIIWWDIPGGVINKERADLIHKTVLELQPNIIMNNRLGGGYRGDTETPERQIPATGFPGRDWETCMTMNETWGFKKNDHDWKSTTTLIRQLATCASMGGNFLLNVGPTAEGEIPPPSLERMAEMGKWLQVNGEAVYGTSASPFPKGVKWGRATQKGNMLYLVVFDLPKDRALLMPGLKTPVKSAWLLADAKKSPLAVATVPKGVTVTLPEGAKLDPHATVVAVELTAKPEVDASAFFIEPEADGMLILKADDADIQGGAIKLEGDHVGFWNDVKDTVSWKCNVAMAGTYAVTMQYACADGLAGSEWEISVGDAKVAGKIDSTGGWGKFTTVDAGTIAIAKPGKTTVTVRATRKPGAAVMNLRCVTLELSKLNEKAK